MTTPSLIEASAPQLEFPPVPGVEFQQSELNIPLVANGDVVEVLKMRAVLRLDRGAPVTNGGGHRQFEFMIEKWEVAGFCDYLGEWVTFTLSDTPQPRSVVVAQQAGADFPAIIVYNAVFDVYVGSMRVAHEVTGLGVGVDAYEIPPRVNVQFQKAFSIGQGLTAMSAPCAEEMTLDESTFTAQATEFAALRA